LTLDVLHTFASISRPQKCILLLQAEVGEWMRVPVPMRNAENPFLLPLFTGLSEHRNPATLNRDDGCAQYDPKVKPNGDGRLASNWHAVVCIGGELRSSEVYLGPYHARMIFGVYSHEH